MQRNIYKAKTSSLRNRYLIKRRLNMKRKGQAAMEFLMTYGWAILAAIVVIAVLAIYFRPSTLVSSSTFITAPFFAQGQTINTTDIRLEVKNNGGESVTVDTFALSITTPSGQCRCDY
jgi:hypothetical protein